MIVLSTKILFFTSTKSLSYAYVFLKIASFKNIKEVLAIVYGFFVVMQGYKNLYYLNYIVHMKDLIA